jgi:hypothetical protein
MTLAGLRSLKKKKKKKKKAKGKYYPMRARPCQGEEEGE